MTKELTDDQKRIAIAEACGIKRYVRPFDKKVFLCLRNPRDWETTDADVDVVNSDVPDYLGSLDAMHEAEENLTWDQQCQMHNFLCATIPCTQMVWRSSARQRADAFLKTIE